MALFNGKKIRKEIEEYLNRQFQGIHERFNTRDGERTVILKYLENVDRGIEELKTQKDPKLLLQLVKDSNTQLDSLATVNSLLHKRIDAIEKAIVILDKTIHHNRRLDNAKNDNKPGSNG